MLITNDEVKEYISYTDTDIDTPIDNVISRVNNEVLNMIGQQIETTTTDVIIRGINKSECLLVNTPVTAINSLSYRATPLDSWTVISSSEYALQVREGLTYWIYYNTFSSSYEYKANITYGYASVPEAVKSVAIDMTIDKLLESSIISIMDSGRHGLNSRAIGMNGDTGTTVFNNDKTNYWDRLAPYQVIFYTY